MAVSFKLYKSFLETIIPPLRYRQILLTRIQCCSTKSKIGEQGEENNQEQERCLGINYFKDGTDPPLLPNSEYPDWLWNLTDPKKSNDESTKQSATYWKKINKRKRRQENEIRKQKKF